jgi:hypothetical protein
VCGIRLGQGLGSCRTRGCLPGSDPTLNPHIAWYKKTKPVNPELDALVDQARQVITGIEPQQLRDSVRLRAMVANDFTRIEQAVGDLLVDRPRRNILRRGQTGAGT